MKTALFGESRIYLDVKKLIEVYADFTQAGRAYNHERALVPLYKAAAQMEISNSIRYG